MIYYGATAALCLPERAGSGACVDPCSHDHRLPRPGVASMHRLDAKDARLELRIAGGA